MCVRERTYTPNPEASSGPAGDLDDSRREAHVPHVHYPARLPRHWRAVRRLLERLGFGVWGLGSGVWGLGFGFLGFGFGV